MTRSAPRSDALTLIATLVACTALAAPVRAQEGEAGTREFYRMPAVRVTEQPQIDGVLDEPLWARAALIDDFVQQEPDEGAPATERTEVRVAYGASSLYVGVRAFDSQPPIATEMRRDADRILDEDSFQIILDTFMDSRTAYMFVVSPLGAQLDQQVSNEGGRDRLAARNAINRDWDGVWSVATSRFDGGWIAEIEIPVVMLRFPGTDSQSWGINFMRDIRRKNEQVFWAPIPKAFTITRVSLAGALEGIEDLDRGLDLRVKPFVAGGGRLRQNLGVDDRSTEQDVGIDVKYGVTPSLNLDVTVNTDFAQAEIDNEQVNLTRFPLFFPEKRDFFLENSAQFAVGTPNSIGRIADLFFSRNIGLNATGATVPIIAGARLTGKVGSNNIALMDIQTDDAYGLPGENFLVARYSRDVFGRSQIGGLVINKQATSGGGFNRTYAADMNIAVTTALTVDGFIAGTETGGPGGDGLGGNFRAGYMDNSWRLYGEYTNLSDDFNPEVGFVPRVGTVRRKVHLEHTPRPGRWGIRSLNPMWYWEQYDDQSGRLQSRKFHNMVGANFENGASLVVQYNLYVEDVTTVFRVGGVPIDVGRYDFQELNLSFRSDPSRRLYYSLGYAPQSYYGGDRTDWSASLGLRVTDRLATSASFSRNDVSIPNGDFVADIWSAQVDYAFSPRISLRSLTQYNSLTEQLSANARLRYTFRPGSDIYVVYDGVRRDIPLTAAPFLNEYRDHRLLVKVTYLFSF